ncbi:hypothetical protein [Laribacter hongkongensis]|uniref:hypothetical protein n=1 Tax=Laribacter hongkongensis TaxID=168471 RepID=UPI001EFEE46C|nr:hypothetical protein [Laribacter hongkongensis]MCG9079475.1 hypothetical protein [Laribacter hongkongensis]
MHTSEACKQFILDLFDILDRQSDGKNLRELQIQQRAMAAGFSLEEIDTALGLMLRAGQIARVQGRATKVYELTT